MEWEYRAGMQPGKVQVFGELYNEGCVKIIDGTNRKYQ